MICYKKILVYRKMSFFRKTPKGENIKGLFYHFKVNHKYNCPNLYVYYFKKVNLLPDSTLFCGIFPLDLSFLFFKKRLRIHSVFGIFKIRRSWERKVLEKNRKYLVIHDQWTKNYYHWITQALPRLLLASKLETDFVLLLPKDHNNDFHGRTLEILGVKKWIFLENCKTLYTVYDLIYPSHDIQVGDYNDRLIRELSSTLRSSVEVEKPLFLFIHRQGRNGRTILNEEEVLKTFVSYGFLIVEFDNISFDEQLALMGRASVLAGVHGAGLTNMIFMPEGGVVFELTTRLKGDQYYYYTLSNAVNHSYYYQLCQSDDEEKTIQDANLIVDLCQLSEKLEQILLRYYD